MNDAGDIDGVRERPRLPGRLRLDFLPADRVIVLDEAHLRRVLREYVAYHHEDRTHCGLGKETPARRAIERRPSTGAKVVGLPRLTGLHHRYVWREAA